MPAPEEQQKRWETEAKDACPHDEVNQVWEWRRKYAASVHTYPKPHKWGWCPEKHHQNAGQGGLSRPDVPAHSPQGDFQPLTSFSLQDPIAPFPLCRHGTGGRGVSWMQRPSSKPKLENMSERGHSYFSSFNILIAPYRKSLIDLCMSLMFLSCAMLRERNVGWCRSRRASSLTITLLHGAKTFKTSCLNDMRRHLNSPQTQGVSLYLKGFYKYTVPNDFF